MILAIDPGTTESGWCVFDNAPRLIASGVKSNGEMLAWVRSSDKVEILAIEMIASYGMPVGAEVFQTCVWIGRFMEAWRSEDGLRRIAEDVKLVYRRDVKLHLCGNPRAKDGNIRQAIIDKLGPIGTKAQPGPLYGVKSHAWAAVGVALTALSL